MAFRSIRVVTIRVALAEPQAVVLGAVASLLAREMDMDVVAEVRDGLSALTAVRDHLPEVLVSEIDMIGATGIEVANRISTGRLPPV